MLATYLNAAARLNTRNLVSIEFFDRTNSSWQNRYLINLTIFVFNIIHNWHQKIMWSKQEQITILSTSILVTILNIVEIISIAKIKRRKRIYEIILASLSVSDCLFSLLNAMIASIFLSMQWQSQQDLLKIMCIAFSFFIIASVFHLLFIAVDRVMIVLIPLQYETAFSAKRQKYVITLLWILAFAISISTYVYYDVTISENKIFSRERNDSNTTGHPLVSVRSKKNETKSIDQLDLKIRILRKNIPLVLSAIIVISHLLMILCYSTIIYQMSYKKRKFKATKSVKDEGLYLLCVFIAGVFVLFTSPFVITTFYLRKFPFWTKFCLILNSGMNSIVYFFRHRIETYQSKDSRMEGWIKDGSVSSRLK